MLPESLFKRFIMHIVQCNSMIFGGLVDSPIIPVTNFQFVTNISGDDDRNEEKLYMLPESLFKGYNAYPQYNSMFWVV